MIDLRGAAAGLRHRLGAWTDKSTWNFPQNDEEQIQDTINDQLMSYQLFISYFSQELVAGIERQIFCDSSSDHF